ncbi:20008_t:CDS:2 [Dentiscutata erythropus]|uniref:20008_t:CDS:1 n=1 Tax=Dentiscutata erythropus TaxID=1348616 RepID=A0A9N8Z1V9_9GLOM|nr:20008_t:CDS:2 [Dentiscutata erythropus]
MVVQILKIKKATLSLLQQMTMSIGSNLNEFAYVRISLRHE